MQSVFLPLTAVLLVVSTPVMAETTDTEPVNILVADFSRAEDGVCQPGVIAGWIKRSLEEFDSIEVVLLNEMVSAEENTEFYMELMRSAECDLIVFGSVENIDGTRNVKLYYMPADNFIEGNPVNGPILKEFSFDLTDQPQEETPETVLFNSYALATISLLNAQQFDHALEASENTLDLAETIGSSEDQSSAFSIRGMVLLKGFSDTEQTLADFNTALFLNPENASALQNRASVLINSGNYAGAIEDLTTLIRIEPGKSSFLFFRGAAYSSAGLHEYAVEDFNNYIQIVPDDPASHYALGRTYYNLSENQSALAEFRRAIEIDSLYIDAYLEAAYILIEVHETGEAASLLNTARAINEENLGIYNLLIIVNIQNENWDAVRENVETGLRIAPDDPFFYKSRAIANLEQNRFEEALDDIETVISCFRRGNYGSTTYHDPVSLEETANALRTFVTLPANSSEYFLQRGLYLIYSDRFEAAIEDFTQALSIDSKTVYALYHRGIARARIGDKEGAVQDIEAFLLVCPEESQDAEYARSQLNYIMQQ